MTDVTHLATAQAEIRRRVASIGARQWDLPTPCTDWTVRKLVVHMIEGSRMAVAAPRRARRPRRADRCSAWTMARTSWPSSTSALADELAAFEAPDAFEMVVHHPAAGDVPGPTLYQFRTVGLPAAQLGRRPGHRR